MPAPERIGNAAIVWAATSENISERVHLLQTPLRSLRPAADQEVFVRHSLDRSAYEVTAVGDGANELIGRVKFEGAAQSLMDLIRAGSRGAELTYIPELSDPDVKYVCNLMAPLVPTSLELDGQRGVLGDQSVELRLRVTDETPLHPLYKGTGVLFSWRAGEALFPGSSFVRATSTSAPASYAARGPGGYGTLSTAKSNEARILWESTASSDGPRTFPTLLLEDTRRNYCPESEDLGQWTLVATAAVSSGQSDPLGATAGFALTDDSTTATQLREIATTTASTGRLVLSWFQKASTDQLTGQMVVRDRAGSSDIVQASISWSSGIPSVSFTFGEAANPDERWRDGFYRLTARSTAEFAASSSFSIRVLPAATANGATGRMHIFGVQLEVAP